MSFGLDDIKGWRQDRHNNPPMKGSYQVGGMATAGRPLPSFPAVLDGNPQENIRICVSSSSTCNVFDFNTYKRGKLHKEFPYNQSYEPFRSGTDTVTLSISSTGTPMKVYGRASIPVEIEGYLFQADAYLTDLHSSVQGIFSHDFLIEYEIGLEATPDGMQKLILKAEEETPKPPMTGSYEVGGMAFDGQPLPSFPAVLDGNPPEDIRICVAGTSTCNAFDFKTYKRGKLHEEHPHNLDFEPIRPGTDTVTLSTGYIGSPMTVYGRAVVPINIEGTVFQVKVYLTDLHSSVQGIFSYGFLKEFRLGLVGAPGGMQRIILKAEDMEGFTCIPVP